MSKRQPATSKSQRPRNPYVTLRATTIPNKRKEASRRACRGTTQGGPR